MTKLATPFRAGLMGAGDKLKLDGLTVGTAANNLVQLDGSAKLPAVDGSQLTGIDTGGLTQIGQTVISAPVAIVEFTNIPNSYDHLYISFDGVSNQSVNTSIRVKISNDNGASYSANTAISPTINNANFLTGGFTVFGYNNNIGSFHKAITEFTSIPTTPALELSTSHYAVSWASPGGIDAIAFEWSSGNFDAGTITLYGF